MMLTGINKILFFLTILGSLLLGIGIAQIQTEKNEQLRQENISPAKAARAFLNSLDTNLQSKVSFEFNSHHWYDWTASPVKNKPHHGISFKSLNNEQLAAFLKLVRASLSEQGYQKVINVIATGDLLAKAKEDSQFAADNYFVAIFGTPTENDAEDKPWGWQLDGHHLALNVVLEGDKISITPSFIGLEPAEYTLKVRPLGDEYDKAIAFVNSLNLKQQVQAASATETKDVLTGTGKVTLMPNPEGISAAELNDQQQEKLLDFISEWVNNLKEPAAKHKMLEIKATLTDTYFVWSGFNINSDISYYRVQGPNVFIEFGYEFWAGTDKVYHIHSVYRDPKTNLVP